MPTIAAGHWARWGLLVTCCVLGCATGTGDELAGAGGAASSAGTSTTETGGTGNSTAGSRNSGGGTTPSGGLNGGGTFSMAGSFTSAGTFASSGASGAAASGSGGGSSGGAAGMGGTAGSGGAAGAGGTAGSGGAAGAGGTAGSGGTAGAGGAAGAGGSGGKACGSVQLAPTAATASGSERADLGPQFAIDGDSTTTRWASDQMNDAAWLQLDMGEAVAVNRVVIVWEAAYATDYKLQIASDPAGPFTTMYEDKAGAGGTSNVTTLTPSAGRYVRMQGVTRKTTYGYSIFEMTIYGDKNESCK